MSNATEVNAERSLEALPERASGPLAERSSGRFSEMAISPYMKERLAAGRFTTPTPVQAAAIPQALEGKDVLATAQTGTGKTLAFLIPVIEKLLQQKTTGIAALVLVPTRELAMQVVDQYNALRGKQLSPAALVVGGLPEAKQLAAIRAGARLVVATPGRLEDYLGRNLFNFRGLHVLVLDESDRMQEMLQHLLAKETGRCLVFARTKRGTDKLARNLNREGFAAAVIHGDRSQSQRTAALTGFQQGRYRILVATDVAARGIHVQDIAHVINYDLPEIAENFIHRVGRTGRAGKSGVASTLF